MLQLFGLVRWIGFDKIFVAGSLFSVWLGAEFHQGWLIKEGLEGLAVSVSGALILAAIG